MSETTLPSVISGDNSEVLTAPVNLYADQLALLQIGRFTTRFTVGKDTGKAGSLPEPIATITMPSDAAFFMASEILRSLNSEETKQKFDAAVSQYRAMLQAQK